ncbi:uncharacterized protein DS421_17g579350 [Arachis hypogaea]|nr:uncharacterized protein DS421_17g579350 [Arachis hypogaea]
MILFSSPPLPFSSSSSPFSSPVTIISIIIIIIELHLYNHHHSTTITEPTSLFFFLFLSSSSYSSLFFSFIVQSLEPPSSPSDLSPTVTITVVPSSSSFSFSFSFRHHPTSLNSLPQIFLASPRFLLSSPSFTPPLLTILPFLIGTTSRVIYPYLVFRKSYKSPHVAFGEAFKLVAEVFWLSPNFVNDIWITNFMILSRLMHEEF